MSRFSRFFLISVSAVLLISCCWLDADAQTRRRRTRRTTKPVITNPSIALPGEEQTAEPRIISTAEDSNSDMSDTQDPDTTEKTTPKKVSEQERMQQTINSLSNQVERLNDKLSQMQENDRALLDMERLTRAEQRSESLRTQLLDAESKLADLQSRLEQIEFSLRPENIERSTAGYGSLHPEDARETRRKQLENEKTRTETQIRILEQSKARLEQSIATADAEVDRLRRKLEQREQREAAGQTETEMPPAKDPEPLN